MASFNNRRDGEIQANENNNNNDMACLQAWNSDLTGVSWHGNNFSRK